MIDYDVFGPFLIALMMSMGAVCIFIWGVLSGAFHNSDAAALSFFNAETRNVGTRSQADETVE